jgi:integrase/recombinase XerC
MKSGVAFNTDLAGRYERWLVAQKYAKSTRGQYNRAVREYCEFLGAKPFTKSTHFDIQEFMAFRAKADASARTLRGLLFALRIFFDFLSLGGLMQWVPPRFVRPRAVKPTVPRVLSTEQVKRLFTATRNKFERAVLEMFYGTGCRTGELCSMRVEDVDFAKRRILVRGKRGERFVMFTSHVLNSLRRYLEGRKSGYLFVDNKRFQQILPMRTRSGAWHCNWRVFNEEGRVIARRHGFVKACENLDYLHAAMRFSRMASKDRIRRPVGVRPVTSGLIDRAVRTVGLRAGVKVFPYRLRHSFATHLLDNGADIRVIQELMGHANIRSTQTYADVSNALILQTIRKFHPRR